MNALHRRPDDIKVVIQFADAWSESEWKELCRPGTTPDWKRRRGRKEYYFYLDSTPTHSYMKYLYEYPQATPIALIRPSMSGTISTRESSRSAASTAANLKAPNL